VAEAADQSTEDTDASAEAPASPGSAVDLDAIIAALDGKLNERFSGFQSLIDKRISPLAEQLDELKTAGMSPEEREQLEDQATTDHYAKLERENAMLKLRSTNPDAVDFLMSLDQAESFEDQLGLIATKFGQKVADNVEAAAQDEAEGEEATPAVDPNRSARSKAPGIQAALDGQLTDASADALLQAASGRSLASFRKQNG
jgi:hypothetical protein